MVKQELYRDHGLVIYQEEQFLMVYCALCDHILYEMDQIQTFKCTTCAGEWIRPKSGFPEYWYGAHVRFVKDSEPELEEWVRVWLSGRGVVGEVEVSIEW